MIDGGSYDANCLKEFLVTFSANLLARPDNIRLDFLLEGFILGFFGTTALSERLTFDKSSFLA